MSPLRRRTRSQSPRKASPKGMSVDSDENSPIQSPSPPAKKQSWEWELYYHQRASPLFRQRRQDVALRRSTRDVAHVRLSQRGVGTLHLTSSGCHAPWLHDHPSSLHPPVSRGEVRADVCSGKPVEHKPQDSPTSHHPEQQSSSPGGSTSPHDSRSARTSSPSRKGSVGIGGAALSPRRATAHLNTS